MDTECMGLFKFKSLKNFSLFQLILPSKVVPKSWQKVVTKGEGKLEFDFLSFRHWFETNHELFSANLKGVLVAFFSTFTKRQNPLPAVAKEFFTLLLFFPQGKTRSIDAITRNYMTSATYLRWIFSLIPLKGFVFRHQHCDWW